MGIQEPGQSATRFAVSKDGTQIAYDVTGSGPFVMLLHGGGQNRRAWHDAGYVSRLAKEFAVITVDLRGNGESDKPANVSEYAIDRLIQDLLAVADACDAHRFTLWGFSYGANIGRYLASRSDRVQAMVHIGIPFGPATEGKFRQLILDMRAKWLPVIEAERIGKLDLHIRSPKRIVPLGSAEASP
jgi:pimeloyl-ACP methyl ester carboxylesterase